MQCAIHNDLGLGGEESISGFEFLTGSFFQATECGFRALAHLRLLDILSMRTEQKLMPDSLKSLSGLFSWRMLRACHRLMQVSRETHDGAHSSSAILQLETSTRCRRHFHATDSNSKLNLRWLSHVSHITKLFFPSQLVTISPEIHLKAETTNASVRRDP